MAKPDPRLARLFKDASLLRSRDIENAGINRKAISRHVAEGRLKRLGRGLYCLPDHRQGKHGDFAIVTKRIPEAMICLLSALWFHGLTTQAPPEVWIAVPRRVSATGQATPRLKIQQFSGPALRHGVVTVRIEGVPVRITSVEKTIADCFKFRKSVGLDVAIESVKEARRRRLIDQDELWICAKVDYVTRVMQPYLDGLA